MGKQKAVASGSFLSELFQVGLYKPSQGRVTRQVTFVALAVTCFLAAIRLFYQVKTAGVFGLSGLKPGYLAAGIVLAVGGWLSYRSVNFPKFADFLIAVEAEMNKVSWPTRGELIRSSIVVIIVILGLAGLLFGYDALWQFVFTTLGVLKRAKGA